MMSVREGTDRYVHTVSALNGNFTQNEEHWGLPQWQLLCFVSSTFTDTHIERNILQEVISPKLKEIAEREHIDVTFVDLRYGIQDDNTLNHKIWYYCEREIHRCYKTSTTGPFFLSLQSGKYGYRPLPSEISVATHESLLAIVPQLADRWFLRDDNAIPPIYYLKPLSSTGDDDFHSVFPQLLTALEGLPFQTAGALSGRDVPLAVGSSISEFEFQTALSLDASRCIWVHREFTGAVPAEHPKFLQFSEAVHDESSRVKLAVLKQLMSEKLPERNIYALPIDMHKYLNSTDDDAPLSERHDYFVEWEQIVHTRLAKELELMSLMKRQWDQDGLGTGLEGGILEDMLAHLSWANKKRQFIGQEELINNALSVMYSPKEGFSNIFGVTFVLMGESGVGKTSLMSRLAALAFDKEASSDVVLSATPCSGHSGADKGRPVVIRFCGTTNRSSDIVSLLKSIVIQLKFIFSTSSIEASAYRALESFSYDQILHEFQCLLRDYAVILFIDSIDQLSDAHESRSKLKFLENLRPHKDTLIVLSCLPDTEGKYMYGTATTLMEEHVATLVVNTFKNSSSLNNGVLCPSPFTGVEPRYILNNMLAEEGRCLTEIQWEFVLTQMDKSPTALYIKLCCLVVQFWRSSDVLSELYLATTVNGLINQLFSHYEREYGDVLTKTAFALITFSVGGISDNEIIDVLSLDDAVLFTVFQYSTPNVRRLPSHVWIRLRSDISEQLVMRENNCLRWYHRQFQEVASSRYQGMKTHANELLATYFGNLVPLDVRVSRKIKSQQLSYSKKCIWLQSKFDMNTRRCQEAAHHLVELAILDNAVDPERFTNRLESAMNELCSFENIFVFISTGEGFNTVERLMLLNHVLNSTGSNASQDDKRVELATRCDHYLRWLSRDMSRIILEPKAIISYCFQHQPLCSTVRKELFHYLKTSKIDVSKQDIFSAKFWIRQYILGGKYDFDLLEKVLCAHTQYVSCVCWNKTGTRLVSGSADKTIVIWDTLTGNVLRTLVGHRSAVTCVAFSKCGNFIASAAETGDDDVWIWNAVTGTAVKKLIGHKKGIYSVSYCYVTNKYIASGSKDTTIRIWNLQDEGDIKYLIGHTSYVFCVRWSADGSRIVSSGFDNSIRVWDVNTTQQLRIFLGHVKHVYSVSWSPCGQFIASGSSDETAKIWSFAKDALVLTLSDHSADIHSIDFDSSGRYLATCSRDGTMNIYSVSAGGALEDEAFTCHLSSKLRNVSKDALYTLSWSLDSQLIATGSNDSNVCIWSNVNQLNEGKDTLNSTTCHTDVVFAVDFSPDGRRVVSASGDTTIRVFDLQTDELSYVCHGHEDNVHSIVWTKLGNKIISGSRDTTVRIWNADTGEMISLFNGPFSQAIGCIAVDTFCKKIAVGCNDENVYILDSGTGELQCVIRGIYSCCVNSLSWNSHGIAIGCNDNKCRIYKIASDSTIESAAVFDGHEGFVYSLSMSPNGLLLAMGSADSNLYLWDITSSSLMLTLSGHTENVAALSWSADCSLLASGSFDGSIRLWEIPSGLMRNILRGHSWSIYSLCFSASSDKLVSGSRDCSVRLWDTSD